MHNPKDEIARARALSGRFAWVARDAETSIRDYYAAQTNEHREDAVKRCLTLNRLLLWTVLPLVEENPQEKEFAWAYQRVAQDLQAVVAFDHGRAHPKDWWQHPANFHEDRYRLLADKVEQIYEFLLTHTVKSKPNKIQERQAA